MPVVRVSWFEGKEAQAKAVVAKEITESIVKNTGPMPVTSTSSSKTSSRPTGPGRETSMVDDLYWVFTLHVNATYMTLFDGFSR